MISEIRMLLYVKLRLIFKGAGNPIDTGRKLNIHKTFRRRPGRLLKVLCMFNLRPVSTGKYCKVEESSVDLA